MIPVNLSGWMTKHHVSQEAMRELAVMYGVTFAPPIEVGTGASEAEVQSRVRLEAPPKSVFLFRNNVGVLPDRNGRPVRYGLANETPAQNKKLKSADLIGWRDVLVQPYHVGTVIAQFVSRECKRQDWRWSGDEHEVAQLAWAELVNAHGGDAQFATSEGTL
jgi:hypothetical protein